MDEISSERLVMRNEINKFIAQLQEYTKGSKSDIASEMLIALSNLTSNNEINVNTDSFKHFDSSDHHETEGIWMSIKELRTEIKTFDSDFKKGKETYSGYMSSSLGMLNSDYTPRALAPYKDEIQALSSEIEALLKKEAALEQQRAYESELSSLKQDIEREIYSMATVKSILSRIKKLTSLLESEHRLTSDEVEFIIFHKERCAVHRAEKKTKEAKTAEENGKHAKAQKLRDEAYSFLKEDWSKIVGDKEYPDIRQ